MEFFSDLFGNIFGSLSHGDYSDTIYDAHNAVAGHIVHGLGPNPDLIQDASGNLIGHVQGNIFGGVDVTDSTGHVDFSIHPGLGSYPDMILDPLGGLQGAVQHGPPGLGYTLLGPDWEPIARSFGLPGL